MQFVKPIHFTDAAEKIGTKTAIGSALNSQQWSEVPVALRDRAFFSSTVENVRWLQSRRDSITNFLAGARETLTSGETALKAGSRQTFVKLAMEDAIRSGMGDLVPENKRGGLQDITSEKRLGLIFDNQTRQAQDYAFWKQGQDPDVLDAFPAQRFIREIPVKEPRDFHRGFEGEVHLKSDLSFWQAINQDFGVPWGPWGWGCGHGVEDVDRSEAEALGLIQPGEAAQPVQMDFNERLQASTKGLDPDILEVLKTAFGSKVKIEGDSIRWADQPAEDSTY